MKEGIKIDHKNDNTILRAKDLQKLTGMSRSYVYGLFHREDFPTSWFGKVPTVRADRFWEWYDTHEKLVK